MPERIAASKLSSITNEPFNQVLINSFIEKPHFQSSIWQGDGNSCAVFYPATGFCLYHPGEDFESWANWFYQQKINLLAGELKTHYELLKKMAELYGDEQLECRFEIQDFCILQHEQSPHPAVSEAKVEDLDKLVAFYAEAEDMADRSKEDLAEILIAGRIFFIEKEDKVISCALTQRESSNAALVGGVYTLPDHRGQGLSQACVGTMCHVLQQENKTPCLFYQQSNQEARMLYSKLGFVYHGDWIVAEIHYK